MTIDKKSSGETKGRQGSSSRNIVVLGREILTPDEVRMMDNKKCLVFIRGLNPVLDNKYFTPKHPRFAQSADGNGKPFRFVPRLPENLLARSFDILTPEGLKQYEKRKAKGEAVYIDLLTYEEFMMLDELSVSQRFAEMDQKETEQEFREEAGNETELAYTPDEETEKNLVAELIALKKQAAAKEKTKVEHSEGSSEDDSEKASGETLADRLAHFKFSPAQRSEIKRAADEKIPEEYILSYALPENSIVKMAAMRRKYGQSSHNNNFRKGD